MKLLFPGSSYSREKGFTSSHPTSKGLLAGGMFGAVLPSLVLEPMEKSMQEPHQTNEPFVWSMT
jgi:hypothetical protein